MGNFLRRIWLKAWPKMIVAIMGILLYFRDGFIVVDDVDPKVVKVTLPQYAKRSLV